MSPQRVVISGATGYVGRWLVRECVRAGHAIAAITRREGTEELCDLGVHVIRHDGKTERLARAVAEFSPEVAFHLAALFVARHKAADVQPLVESNLLFGTQFAEACCEAGVRAFVNAATSWQNVAGIDYSPACLYAATKQAFECVLRYYTDLRGMSVVNLKLYDTYGPGDTRKKILQLMIEAARCERVLRMSPGFQRLSLLHVEDVVRAFLLAATRLTANEAVRTEQWAVRTEHAVSLRELACLVEEVMGRKLHVQWGAIPYRDNEIMDPWAGGEVLPGWVPRISLRDGVRQLADQCSH